MEEGLLSLKWNNHKSAFTTVLPSLREKELHTDATLACEGKFFPVHKIVLSVCSDYFNEAFGRTSCKSPVVILKGIKSNELKKLLDYMYMGEVGVRQNELASFIKAAECLEIKDLASLHNHQMVYNISPSEPQDKTIVSPPPKRQRTSSDKAYDSNPVHRQSISSHQTSTTETNPTIFPVGAIKLENTDKGVVISNENYPAFEIVKHDNYSEKLETIEKEEHDDCISAPPASQNENSTDWGNVIHSNVKHNANSLSQETIEQEPTTQIIDLGEAQVTVLAGSSNNNEATKECNQNNKKRRPRKCPDCSKVVVHLARHLKTVHGFTEDEALSVSSFHRQRKNVTTGRCCPIAKCLGKAPYACLDKHLRFQHHMSTDDEVYKSIIATRSTHNSDQSRSYVAKR